MSKKKRPHGHYCKICGEYKANEKFSGKGHAAHICKNCSRLSAAEKAAAMDMNRLMDFPMRRLSENEKKWLKAKMHDQCPEVADTAREVFNVCFPHAERNAMKKQLIINTLSFEVNTEVYDGYGDMEMADRHFAINRKNRVLTMVDHRADGGEQSVMLEGGDMAKLLRYIVHTLEIFMWEQDYCLNPDEDDFLRIFFQRKIFMWMIQTKKRKTCRRSRRADRHGRCRWNTVTILCRIFQAITITCQSVRKNCTFHYWSILSRMRKNWMRKNFDAAFFSYPFLSFRRQFL